MFKSKIVSLIFLLCGLIVKSMLSLQHLLAMTVSAMLHILLIKFVHFSNYRLFAVAKRQYFGTLICAVYTA